MATFSKMTARNPNSEVSLYPNTTEVQHMPMTIYKRLEKYTGSESRHGGYQKDLEICRDVRRTECLILQDRKHFSTLKTGTVCSSETSINFYSIAGPHIAEDNILIEVISVTRLGMSRESVFGTVTRPRARQPRNRKSNSSKGERFPALI
jgi:hypothetical protein